MLSAWLRPAAAVQSPAAEGWLGYAPAAGKLAKVWSLDCGLALWGRLRLDPDASQGKWWPRRAPVGLGPPGTTLSRRAVEQEARASRGPRLGRHRPPLAPAGGAELGVPEGGQLEETNPKMMKAGLDHGAAGGHPGRELRAPGFLKRF